MSDAALALVDLLCSGKLRAQTGIILLAEEEVGCEEDLAARLNVSAVDCRHLIQEGLPPTSPFVNLTATQILLRLNDLAMEETGRSCALVYNLDLALAKLKPEERRLVWESLRVDFAHRRRSLVLAVPVRARQVLPQGVDWEAWESSERLAFSG